MPVGKRVLRWLGPKSVAQKLPENVLCSFHRIFFLVKDAFSMTSKSGHLDIFMKYTP